MDLKGSIRVFCRARPLLPKELKEGGGTAALAVTRVNDMTLQAVEEDARRGGRVARSFDFDCVFGQDETQADMFEEAEGLVTSVLDGFNVCVLAYGQTGSGKTYTMEGPRENPGLNLRALGKLFEMKAEAEGKDISIGASNVEIYNEEVRDLLGKDSKKKMEIRQGPDGNHVPGLVIAPVGSVDDVLRVIAQAGKNRATFATNMNEHSSRSHAVLTVHVEVKDAGTGEHTRSKLHMVDLAGSERLSKTGATGDRLLEAQSINKSLSALGNVIQSLQAKSSHVPYRDCKLTYLLADSLGGNSKTLMVMCVSPAASNAQETMCTLKFGQRANKVELGKATKNVVK